MQKKLASILFSTRLTAMLFLGFAISMAIGTFMDRASETSPTPYSRELIYEAWWFEAIMLLFAINFVGNIFRFRLYRKVKWATLTLHLAFILILIGAFVTRYIGYEGVMPIREGATENTFLSSDTYLKVFIDGDYKVDGVAQRRKVPLKKLDHPKGSTTISLLRPITITNRLRFDIRILFPMSKKGLFHQRMETNI